MKTTITIDNETYNLEGTALEIDHVIANIKARHEAARKQETPQNPTHNPFAQQPTPNGIAGTKRVHVTWKKSEMRTLKQNYNTNKTARAQAAYLHTLIPNHSPQGIISQASKQKLINSTNTRANTKYGGKDWSLEDVEKLKTCITEKHVDYEKAHALLPQRTIKALQVKASRIVRGERTQPKITKTNRARERMTFVNNRATYYYQTYKDSWEKARSRAFTDWNQKLFAQKAGVTGTGQQITHANMPQTPNPTPSLRIDPHPLTEITPASSFLAKPVVAMIADHNQDVVRDFMKHLSQNGGVLNKEAVMASLDLHKASQYVEWTGTTWRAFVYALFYHAQKYSDYLSVPNKFKIVGQGLDVNLTYQ